MHCESKLVKRNGYPTLYGYGCGNGMAEVVTQPDGHTCIVRLTPFCNGLNVKGNGVLE